MDLSNPQSAVTGSALLGSVLVVLAGTTKALTGRQVARLATQGSERGIQLALHKLAEQGLVDSREAPPAVLYELNRDHIAAPVVEALAGLRAELLKRLRATIDGWPIPATHASMFGSAARGDGDVDSDIDLFVVRPGHVSAEESGWRSQIEDLAHDVERWTGNRAGISEVGSAEIGRLIAARPPIVEDLVREGVTLAGPSARQLFSPLHTDAG